MLRGERPYEPSIPAATSAIWVDFLRGSCKVSPVSDEAWPRLTRGANAFWRTRPGVPSCNAVSANDPPNDKYTIRARRPATSISELNVYRLETTC